MRKPVVILMGVAIAALLGTTGVLYSKYTASTKSFAELQAEEQSTRNRYGAAINEIAAIQDSLNAIALGETDVKLLSSELKAERQLTGSQGDEALERIAVLKAGVERTKEKVRELDANLKKSGVKISGLERMIANLKKTVTEKETAVAFLSGQVDSLQTTVTGLAAEVQVNQTTIQAQAETIEERRRELGTVYYVIGTRKDLSTSGTVVAKGGVLGLGKTLEPSGTYNESAFTAIDTDAQTVIRIPAAKAKVLSDQPISSYELLPVDGELELRILDPKMFRTVKHVVIVTT